MEQFQQVKIADNLSGVGTPPYEDYLAHALCLGGSCSFLFNGRQFTLSQGDVMIVRKGKLMARVTPSPDFRVKVIYVTTGFIKLSTPQSNYGTKGSLALFLNPVMHLTPEQQTVCRRDFDVLELRLATPTHRFYEEVMINAVQTMILDFFDFHSQLYDEQDISTQTATVMNRFLAMLENGDYRRHREVSYYADKLCVTAKYLSEVSNKVSGYPANYWINSYTSLDISRMLRDKSLTFVQISDIFGFSSPAYFSRYVKNYLGASPTDFRD
ncbi:MAG: helix-turn-helix domain-containing protein [Bacteroidales bacterium]|nr:helix-turn-helix domain-containing protein [Bacteroidales bacterium]